MSKIWNWLSGKKTYIIALAGIVYSGGIQQGWWPNNVLIDGLLLGGGTASIRHGISSSQAPQAPPAPTPQAPA